MALTAQQLTTFFTNADLGIAPSASDNVLINAYAQQNASGTLSDADAKQNVLALTHGTTDVALGAYQFFTGSAPTAAGLAYLVNGGGNANDLGSAYYANFNTENRYDNFAMNLATTAGTPTATAFAANYGSLTFHEAVVAAYETIVGSSVVGAAQAAAAEASIEASQSYFASVAAQRASGANQDLATKAAMIGYVIEEAVKANVGAYAHAINSFETALGNGAAPAYGSNLLTAYPASVPGQTFALTSDVDHLVGTSGDDTFNANITTATNAVGPLLNTFDSIDGGAGHNTLNVTDSAVFDNIDFGTSGNDGFWGPHGTTVTLANVQTVNIHGEWGVSVDLSGDAALTNVAITTDNPGANISSTGGQVVTTNGGSNVNVYGSALTDVTINGASSSSNVYNYDAATQTKGYGSTLTTVTIENSNANVNVYGSGLTTLNLNSVGDKTHTENVWLYNYNATPATLTVNASSDHIDLIDTGGAYSFDEIDLNVTGTDVVRVNSALTTLKVAGAGSVDLSGSNLSAITTLDASANSGGVTITDSFTKAAVIGGSGTDVVYLTAGATGGSIALGAGNDAVIFAGGTIAGGMTVDGGAGINSISAALVNVGDAAHITNFQLLDVTGFGGGTLDAALMGTVPTGVTFEGGTAGVATIQHLADAASIIDLSAGGATLASVTMTHADATGTLAVNFAQTAASTDTLNVISTGDTAVTVAASGFKGSTEIFNLTETDNHLATITLSGANGFALGMPVIDSGLAAAATATTIASALTTIDASGLTGAFSVTAGASVSPSGNNTVTFTGLVIDGGSGSNIIQNDAKAGVINITATAAAASTNSLTVTDANAVVNISGGHTGVVNTVALTGAGDTLHDTSATIDHVTVGATAITGVSATVNLGSGKGSTVTFSDNTTVGHANILDVLNTGAAVKAVVTDNLTYHAGDVVSIGGATAGHELDFAIALGNAAGALGTGVDVSAAGSFGAAVGIAEAAAQAAGAQHAVWFAYGADSYIVDSGVAATTTDDQVVKIVGQNDLHNVAVNAAGHLVF